MFADRAMWASVALVDYLRNGVPLEDAPRSHLARSLAALMNAYRFDLDEYWERQMTPADGQAFMMVLSQAGYAGFGGPSDLEDNYDAISRALVDRSWPMLRALPDPVWKLLRTITGMSCEEWETLPEFCRGLLSEMLKCPECGHSETTEHFGEPEPIDYPTYGYQQRISLVFDCPKCGTEVTYSITTGKSREFHPSIFGSNRFIKWAIVGTFVGFALLTLLYVLFRAPLF